MTRLALPPPIEVPNGDIEAFIGMGQSAELPPPVEVPGGDVEAFAENMQWKGGVQDAYLDKAREDLAGAGPSAIFGSKIGRMIDPMGIGSSVRSVSAQTISGMLGLGARALGQNDAADELHRQAAAYEQAAAELTPGVAQYPARLARNLGTSWLTAGTAGAATRSPMASIVFMGSQEGSRALQQSKDATGEYDVSHAAKQAAWEILPALLMQRLDKYIPGLGGTESAAAGKAGALSAKKVLAQMGGEATEELMAGGGQYFEGKAAGVDKEPWSWKSLGQTLFDSALLGAVGSQAANAPAAIEKIAALAQKDSISRRDWREAGLPLNMGNTAEERAAFGEEMRAAVRNYWTSQGPQQPGPEVILPDAQPLPPQPEGELPRTDPAGIKAAQEAAAARAVNENRNAPLTPEDEVDLAPPAPPSVADTIKELLTQGPVSVSAQGWKYLVREVDPVKGVITTKQGKILPLDKVASGEYTIELEQPQAKRSARLTPEQKAEIAGANTLPIEPERPVLAETQELPPEPIPPPPEPVSAQPEPVREVLPPSPEAVPGPVAAEEDVEEAGEGAKAKSVEYTGPTSGDRRSGAVLHPSAKNTGQWQVTRFDEDGFSGDTQFKSREEAERDLERDQMVPGGRLLSELATTERFAKGNEKTQLIGMINEGGDHATIMAAYENGGVEAARAALPEAKRVQAEKMAKFRSDREAVEGEPDGQAQPAGRQLSPKGEVNARGIPQASRPVPETGNVNASGPTEGAAEVQREPESPAQAPRTDIRQRAAIGNNDVVDAIGVEDFDAQYAVIDLADLQPSHNYWRGTPAKNENYPATLQPRDYATGNPNDAKVQTFAQQKRARYFISDHPDATNGPPVITASGGITINGNGRAMTLQLAASRNDYEWYRKALLAKSEQFGIPRSEVEKRQFPVLVRVVDVDPESEQARAFAQAGNQVTTQQESPARSAAQLTYLIDSSVLSELNIPDDTTLSAFMAQGGGKKFSQSVRKSLPDSVRPQYYTDDGNLTDAGKEMVRSILLNKVLPVELVERMTDRFESIKNMLEAAVPQMLKLQSQYGKSDVTPQIVEAVEFLVAHPDVTTIANADEALRQGSIFGGKAYDISPAGRMMVDWIIGLRAQGGNYKAADFRKGLSRLLTELETSRVGMFGDKADPVDIASSTLGVDARPGAQFGAKPSDAPQKKPNGKKPKPDVQARVGVATVPTQAHATAEPVAAQDIIKTLSELFGVPVRSGRMGMPKRVAGIYKTKPEVVRTRGKHNADLAVVSHEVAHHIDKKLGLVALAPPDVEEALRGLDYDQKQRRTFEGLAEAIRMMWTGEAVPANVEAWINETIAKQPQTAKNFAKAKELIDRWRGQGATARARSQRKPAGWRARALDKPSIESMKEGGEALRKRLVYELMDRFAAVREFDKTVLGKGWDSEGDATAHQLLAAFNLSTNAHAERALKDGIHTVSSDHRVVGKGLAGVFKDLPTAQYEEWADYHTARHVLDIAEKNPNYNPGLSQEDATTIVQDVSADPEKLARFTAVSDALTQFNNDRLEMLVDAGVLSPGDRKKMLDKWGQTYTSLRRVKDRSLLRRLTATALRVPQPIKGRSEEGSGRPIMDPVEATILNTIDAYDAALKQQVALKLVEMGVPEFGGVEGMGEWIEEVPPNRKATHGRLSELLDAMKEAGFDPELIRELKILSAAMNGEMPGKKDFAWVSGRWGIEDSETLSPKDIVTAAQMAGVPDPEAAIALWRPDFSIKPDERVFRLVIDGNPHLFEISPELYDAMQGMAPIQVPPMFRFLQQMTRLKKLGATGISTTFAAGNILRDLPTFWAQTKHTQGWDSFYLPLAATIWNAKFKNRNEVVKLWEEFGGKIATRLGGDYGSVQNTRADITGHSVGLTEWGSRKLDQLRDIIGLFEAGPRIAEFLGYLRENGYDLKDGKVVSKVNGQPARPPRGVLIGAALAARDVTTDFTRAGRAGRWADQFIPFFNAAVQSNLKFARTAKEIATGDKNWKQRAVALSAMASTALLYALARGDDDDYEEQPDWMRYRYWTYGTGGQTQLRIPKPHDWAIISNLIESIVRMWKDKNPASLAEFAANEVKQRNPVDAPAGMDVVLGLMNYSMFKGGPIESRRMEGVAPSERAYSWTSPAAKFIGKYTGVAGVSPVKVDHILNETSGGLWGKTIGAGSIEDAAQKWSGTSAFKVSRDYSETVEEFYDAAGKATMAAQTAKFKGSPDKSLDAQAAKFAAISDLMTAIRAPVRDEKDRETRFDSEKYITGLARFALGKEELEAYPNPLPRTDLPPHVQAAMDEYLGNKLYALSDPKYDRQAGQSDEELQAKRDEREGSREAAREVMKEAGIDTERAMQLINATIKRRGMKPSSDAAADRRAKLRRELTPP